MVAVEAVAAVAAAGAAAGVGSGGGEGNGGTFALDLAEAIAIGRAGMARDPAAGRRGDGVGDGERGAARRRP